jgi:hypothetical protein
MRDWELIASRGMTEAEIADRAADVGNDAFEAEVPRLRAELIEQGLSHAQANHALDQARACVRRRNQDYFAAVSVRMRAEMEGRQGVQ